MRIARFRPPDTTEVTFGVVEGPPAEAADGLTVAAVIGHPFAPFAFTGERYPLETVRLLSPVIPSKVVCVGKNYLEHAREMGGEVPAQPLIFLKPSTAVVGPGDPICYPRTSTRVDYEGELAVVMGHLARDLDPAHALDAVLGYTIANDVTARDQQHADGQWSRAKGHDSFCPLGPWVETELDPNDLALTTTLDGEVRQSARTSELIFAIPDLLAYITACMTLLPGDVVLTGTPAGIGPMAPGQSVSVTIEGVGTLTNPVVAR